MQHDAPLQAAARDLGLERRPVVALAGDVEMGGRHALEHVEQQLDPLVLLEPAEVEQPRLGGALGGRERRLLDAEIADVDPLVRDAQLDEVAPPRVGDRHERRRPVQPAQRQRLGQQRRHGARPAHLGDVVVAVDVVDERHARLCAATAASRR